MPVHDADAARQLIAEAWDADAPARRVRLAREALALDADATDAYVILARHAADPAERIELLRHGVVTGRRRWAEAVNRPGDHPFWLDPDTRPFMRALFDLALALWDAGERDEAVGLLGLLLDLNADDHQGARYVALSWHAARGDWDAVDGLLARYAQDEGADYLYALALDEFRRGFDADGLLEEAIEANPYVPGYLVGAVSLPPGEGALAGEWGSPEEAAAYARHARAAWENVPGAFDWLVDAWAVVGGPDEIEERDLSEAAGFAAPLGFVPDGRSALEPAPGRVDPLRAALGTGRNDPCPCGSGKKYKKCCGAV